MGYRSYFHNCSFRFSASVRTWSDLMRTRKGLLFVVPPPTLLTAKAPRVQPHVQKHTFVIVSYQVLLHIVPLSDARDTLHKTVGTCRYGNDLFLVGDGGISVLFVAIFE